MATYKLIETVTVGAGGAAYIEFTSIPQTYTDLLVVCSGRTDGAGNGINISFNGNTSNYSSRAVQGNGSSASSYGTYNRNAGMVNDSNQTASVFGSTLIYVPNYVGSTFKSYSADGVSEHNSTTSYVNLVAGLWSDVSAITSLTLSPMAGNFVEYSSASLYGISKT